MQLAMPRISPFLWFDGQAEEAANFYVSIFGNARILETRRFGPSAQVLSVGFELEGLRFTALNGGPTYSFTPAVSFFVNCQDQQEVDVLWDRLCDGGEPSRCGWLKDRFGLSWQIVPVQLGEMLQDPDRDKAGRAMKAMLAMIKLDVAALRAAFDGP